MRSVTAARARLHRLLPPGSLRSRLMHGAFWSVLGAGLSQVVAAGSWVITARVLGKSGFGEFGLMRSTALMLGSFTGLGLDLTATRYLAQLRHNDKERAGRILGLAAVAAFVWGLVLSGVVFMASEMLAAQWPDWPQLSRNLQIMSPMLLSISLLGLAMGGLAGLEAFRQLTLWGAVAAVLAAVATVIGAILRGVEGALWGLMLSSVVSALLYCWVLVRQCAGEGIRPCARGIGRECGVLRSFAMPSMLSGMLVTPVNWATAALLAAQPAGLASLGVFNAANLWRLLILFIPGTAAQVLVPVLADVHHRGGRGQYSRVLNLNIVIHFALALLLAVPMAIASPWIMRLYGSEFESQWLVLVLLSAAAVLQAVPNVIGRAIASVGRMWDAVALNVLWAGELLAAAWYLAPHGAEGMAGAYLIAYALHAVQVGIYTAVVLHRRAADPVMPTGQLAGG